MGRDITVTLPEPLYYQFESWAQATRRPVVDLLLDAALQVLPQAHINPKRPLMQEQVACLQCNEGRAYGSVYGRIRRDQRRTRR